MATGGRSTTLGCGVPVEASVEAVLALIDRRVVRLGDGDRSRSRGLAGRVLARRSSSGVAGPRRSTGRRWTATRSGARRPSGPTPTARSRFDAGRPGPARAGPRPRRRARPGGRDRHRGADARGGRHRRPGRGDRADGRTVRVTEPTPPGRHVGRAGEDIAEGTVVLPAGRVLRPQDLGRPQRPRAGDRVEVVRRPSVAILVTGDELSPAGTPPDGSRIADANSPMLAALVARDGGRRPGRRAARRRPRAIRSAIVEAAAVGRRSADLGGELDRPRGPRPRADRRAGRAGRPRRRDPAGEPDGPGVPRRRSRSSCCRATRSVASAPMTSSPARSSGGSAVGRPPGPIGPSSSPLARKLASVVGRVDYARVAIVGRPGRAAGDQRGLDPLQHHPGRRLRGRPRRPRRLPGRGRGRARSGSTIEGDETGISIDLMAREQEQFLDVVDRDTAERRWWAAIRPRGPAGRAGRRWPSLLGRVLAEDVLAAVDVPAVRPLERRRLRRPGRGDVRGPRRSRPGPSGSTPRSRDRRRPPVAVEPGTATPIATGAMLPRGADAVVMVEHARVDGDVAARPAAGRARARASASPGPTWPGASWSSARGRG